MVQTIQQIPHRLASWAEGCNCHEPLIVGKGVQAQANMFKKHFGDGATTCPLAGARADKCAAGELDAFMDEVWSQGVQATVAIFTDIGKTR